MIGVVLGLVELAARAGVWVHPVGQGYAQFTLGHQGSDQVYLASGRRVNQADPALLGDLSPLLSHGSTSATDLTAYGEIGLGRGWEFVGSAPFRTAANRWSLALGSYPDIVQRNIGLGDMSAGVRYGGQRGAVAFSGYGTGRMPLYSNAPEALAVEAGNSDFEDDKVPLGPGTLDLELGGGVGAGSAHAWSLLEAGIRARSQQFSIVFPLRVQAGIKPVDRFGAWVGADLSQSLGNGKAPDFFHDRWGKGPVAIDNQSALSVGFGAQVDLIGAAQPVGLTASVSRVVWARRFPALTTVSGGVTWKPNRPSRPDP